MEGVSLGVFRVVVTCEEDRRKREESESTNKSAGSEIGRLVSDAKRYTFTMFRQDNCTMYVLSTASEATRSRG